MQRTMLYSTAKGGFWQMGGFRAIYSGLGPVAIFSIPSAALFFCVYETAKTLVPLSDLPAAALAAGVATVVSTSIDVPVEVVKQRAQVTRKPAFRICQETFRAEGSKGLYRGWLATVLQEVPLACVELSLWEALKLLLADSATGKTSPFASGVAGGGLGAVGAVATQPINVARTRIVLSPSHEATATQGVLKTIQQIARYEGWQALYLGVLPRVCSISIGSFVFLGSYEMTRHALS